MERVTNGRSSNPPKRIIDARPGNAAGGAARWPLFARAFEALLCSAIIIYLGTLRIPHFPGDQILSHDKLLHALAFGGLALVLYRALRAGWPRARRTAWVVVSIGYATLLGAVLEILQAMLPYRSMEFADLAADFIGAVSFVLLANRYNLERAPFGLPI